MTPRPSTTIEITHPAEPSDAFVAAVARMCLAAARREVEAETQGRLPTDNQEEDAA